MKSILVTGVNSYIGNAFMDYMKQYSDGYSVEGISVRNGAWKELDFSKYDCVFDVAGIAHVDTGHVSEEAKQRYYEVNTNLAVTLAEKAKAKGVRQFIYMSSAIIYGNSAPIGEMKLITAETVPTPADFYGDSKWQAEKGLSALADDRFHIVILRPPMIYGKNCRGNYPLLSKIARHAPVFPDYKNERSMCYIENFCEFICRLIIKNKGGIFFPQNSGYISTSNLVKLIARYSGHKIFISKIFNFMRLRFVRSTMLIEEYEDYIYEKKEYFNFYKVFCKFNTYYLSCNCNFAGDNRNFLSEKLYG